MTNNEESRHGTLSESVSCRSVLRVGAKVSTRNPIKCPICAKSNRVSGLRNLSREDLAIFRARRSGKASRTKIWRNFACP